jgi:hypothetical protein
VPLLTVALVVNLAPDEFLKELSESSHLLRWEELFTGRRCSVLDMPRLRHLRLSH